MLKGGTNINEWLADRAHLKGVTAILAEKSGRNTRQIYAYCEASNAGRDIRVMRNKEEGAELVIIEIKVLG